MSSEFWRKRDEFRSDLDMAVALHHANEEKAAVIADLRSTLATMTDVVALEQVLRRRRDRTAEGKSCAT